MRTGSGGTTALRALLRVLHRYEPGDASTKRELVQRLSRARLDRARDVLALHEALLFLRAYPDDERVLQGATRALERFGARADLRRFAPELENSGVAGTEISFRFFAPTALRLAEQHGSRLRVDWDEFEHEERLAGNLWMLVPWSESGAFEDEDASVAQHLARLKGPRESDAEFLVRRLATLPMDVQARERFVEDFDLPLRLLPGRGTPSRTLAHFDTGPAVFQHGPLRHARPDVRTEMLRPPRAIRPLALPEARRLVELTRDAMVTRSRDLEAFMHADERDVRLVDCGDGLQFAAIGVHPERRLLLESVYGFLTLKNGVPIGYVLASALMRSAEVAYNVFDTFRGAEAAHVYGRALAMIHALFDVDTFVVYPYQLGHENEEGLRSGAWWFYRKLGFEPRAAGARRLMRAELARMKRNPSHRSSRATLERLAAHHVYFDRGRPRRDVIGAFPLEKVGGAVSRYMARRFGAKREEGVAACLHEARKALGLRNVRAWTADERLWLERWAPLVACLDVAKWTPAETRALVTVIRTKGGRRESDYVRTFDRHHRLRRALVSLAAGVR